MNTVQLSETYQKKPPNAGGGSLGVACKTETLELSFLRAHTPSLRTAIRMSPIGKDLRLVDRRKSTGSSGCSDGI
jgi:hypothetical protein